MAQNATDLNMEAWADREIVHWSADAINCTIISHQAPLSHGSVQRQWGTIIRRAAAHRLGDQTIHTIFTGPDHSGHYTPCRTANTSFIPAPLDASRLNRMWERCSGEPADMPLPSDTVLTNTIKIILSNGGVPLPAQGIDPTAYASSQVHGLTQLLEYIHPQAGNHPAFKADGPHRCGPQAS